MYSISKSALFCVCVCVACDGSALLVLHAGAGLLLVTAAVCLCGREKKSTWTFVFFVLAAILIPFNDIDRKCYSSLKRRVLGPCVGYLIRTI